MAATPYILYPFATSGTVAAVNSTGASTGDMSYQYGFTEDYEKDLNLDPAALPIPRPQFNQLMLDITSSIQRLQLYGVPLWVAPATGSPPVGGPVSYPLFARVGYDPGAPYGYQIWESQIASNTSVPGANGNWLVVSGGRAVRTGSIIESASPNGYVGALLCNGFEYNRVTYAQLFNSITQLQTCVRTNGSTSLVVADSSVMSIGTNAKIEGTGIQAGTYITAIPDATHVTLSLPANASGTSALRFFWFGNGSTSTVFNVPNYQRRVSMGVGGTRTSIIGNRLAEIGGAETYTQKLSDMVNHVHSGIPTTGTNGVATPGSSIQYASARTTTSGIVGYPTTPNPQTSMNIVQSSIVMFKYIKY